MSNRRDRIRKPARRAPHRDPLPRLLIVCEGALTEVKYFEEFRAWCRNPRVAVQVHGPAGVPLSLVDKALELQAAAEARAQTEKDENLLFEEVWCVFDVDDHPGITTARQLANANGLHLAMSNPCFELWLLLHFRENPGAQTRHDVQQMLARCMPAVRKKDIDFPLPAPGYDNAVRRAERLTRDAITCGDDRGRNPSTEVYLLTNSIDVEGHFRRAPKNTQDQQSRRKAQDAAEAAARQARRESAHLDGANDSEESDDPD